MLPNMQVAWNVVLTGLVVIFVVLVLLVYLVKGYGAMVGKLEKKMQNRQPEVREEQEKAEIIHPSEPAVQPEPYVERGIPGEVVAAISAAVYCLYGEAPRSVISVRRARTAGRSSWEMAGLLENTRPF